MSPYVSLVVLLLGCCTISRAQRQLPTVPELDVAAYLGRWYQMYANIFSYATFERNGVCIQATYGDKGGGVISVWNTQRLFEPDGDLDALKGVAYQSDPDNSPGILSVGFPNLGGGAAPYWIAKLGPKLTGSDGVDRYEYSIVTDNVSLYLYVLARDPDRYRINYDSEVQEWLSTNGFTGVNAPIETLHVPECIYV
ncbi:apolipoprotein D-like [Ptychodera flava]|uniref:apolipoprotein D-like n=1 Tax=Ptychodera flava TaxID=63121 RepID=UPI003969EF6C